MVFLEFFILLLIISAAAWALSWGAEELAECYGANFVGSIVLALITTLPEYMFVLFACLRSEYQVAVGSAIGACTLLITLGYGSVILVATSRASRKPVPRIELSRATQIDAFYLLATALVALVLVWWGGGLSLTDGVILLAIFAGYIVHHWRSARAHVQACVGEDGPHKLGWRPWAVLGAAGLVIIALSDPFVSSMIGSAKLLGISPVIIALILGPIASEMPEKLTAYVTVRRDGRLAEISVCNFIGSKVNHNSLLLAMLPVVGLIAHGKTNIEGVLSLPFIVMTALSVVATLSLARRRLEHWQGYLFLLLYVAVVGAAFLGYGPSAH